MLPPSVSADITKYKSQLDEFLSKKYVDQPLLLGFTAVVQSKITRWILDDVSAYYEKIHASEETPQGQASVDFALIELLELLWGSFLHPIVKFYQRQHADLYLQSVDSLRDKKKGTFKVVEMRKLNEIFIKFIKSSSSAYKGILQHMMAEYDNPLLPEKYLSDLGVTLSGSKKCTNADFKANLSFILYHCLLGLGNLSRHSATVTNTYVNPCKSVASYYKHLKAQDKNLASLEQYQPALEYYHKCIGLLPALNEPYNHIGVIYNSVNAKFDAALWFLRSQFTRIPNYAVGKVNLATMFKKPWLEGAFASVKEKPPAKLTDEDINISLLRILASFFFPQFYKGHFNTETAEKEFFGLLFSNPETTRFVRNPALVNQHLTVLICFFCWAEAEKSQKGKKKLGHFLVTYLNGYLRDVADLKGDKDVHLPNLRFILAFLRKQTGVLSFDKGDLNHSVAKAVNALVLNDQEKQTHRLAILTDAYVAHDLPTRTHFFSEDVEFKDFGPIGYQFKDFQDTRLFTSEYVGPLFGGKYFPKAQGIPLYLDNYAVQKITKEFELNSEKLDSEGKRKLKSDLIEEASNALENDMRFCAIVKQVSNNFGDLKLDEFSHLLQVRVEVSATQNGAGSKKKAPVEEKSEKRAPEEKKVKDYATVLREKPKPKAKEKPKKPENAEKKEDISEVQVANLSSEYSGNVAPSSIEEIELIIAGHAQSFRQNNGHISIDTEAGLSDMVDSIIGDSLQEGDSGEVVIPASQESRNGLRTSTQLSSEEVEGQHQIQASSTQQDHFARPLTNHSLGAQTPNGSQTPHNTQNAFRGQNMPAIPLGYPPVIAQPGQTPDLSYNSMSQQSQFFQGPPQPFGFPQGYGMPVYPGMAPLVQGQAGMPGSQNPDFQNYASIYGQPPGAFYGAPPTQYGAFPGQPQWNHYNGNYLNSQSFGSQQ